MNLPRTESQLESPNARTHAGVCAVMVTYNPEPSFEQNVRALLPQVGKLIIVDNQSAAAGHSVVARTAASCEVEVIWNQHNRGIAAGLNAGIDRALATGTYSWIATFDQDSRVPADYVAAILESYSACPFRDEVAIVGANYNQIQDCGDNPIPTRKGFVFREIKSAITSGSLVKSTVFGICGRYDESLFMDYVDHEFCLRLRKHGFQDHSGGERSAGTPARFAHPASFSLETLPKHEPQPWPALSQCPQQAGCLSQIYEVRDVMGF